MTRRPQAGTPESEPIASSSKAPYHPFPRAVFTSVEYPGPVSHPSALLKVVSQGDINECFNKHDPKEQQSLEIRYRGLQDRQSVPVRGLKVPSQKILLKVVKRRRKARRGQEPQGVFTAEIVGTIAHTVRFRGKSNNWFQN